MHPPSIVICRNGIRIMLQEVNMQQMFYYASSFLTVIDPHGI